MANTLYLGAVEEIHDGTIDLDTDTLKVMICNSTYTPANTDDYVDEAGASDPVDAEISVTGYTGGWGGSGRKTATVTLTQSTNKLVVSLADITWTSLGSGATPTHAILIKEGVSDDTDSRLIAAWAISGATNGNDATLQNADFELTVPS